MTPAKTELTTPTPMSFSTLAASPIRLGNSPAAFSISEVKSYFSFRLLRVSLSFTNWVTSLAYSGTLFARSSAWPTKVGTRAAPIAIGMATTIR